MLLVSSDFQFNIFFIFHSYNSIYLFQFSVGDDLRLLRFVLNYVDMVFALNVLYGQTPSCNPFLANDLHHLLYSNVSASDIPCTVLNTSLPIVAPQLQQSSIPSLQREREIKIHMIFQKDLFDFMEGKEKNIFKIIKHA